MRVLPIPNCEPSLSNWAAWCLPDRPSILENSSPRKPKSGARSFARPTSNQTKSDSPRADIPYCPLVGERHFALGSQRHRRIKLSQCCDHSCAPATRSDSLMQQRTTDEERRTTGNGENHHAQVLG